MNEILQKRIEEAADAYSQGKPYSYEQGFLQGCEWLLKNQWISVEEALPTLDEKYDFSERYLVKTNEGAIKVMRIFKNIAWCDIFNGRAFIPFEKKIVTHWMEIPNEGGKE